MLMQNIQPLNLNESHFKYIIIILVCECESHVKYSIDLHTNESVKSIGLGLALIHASTSLSGESLRMRSRIMTRETIGQKSLSNSSLHEWSRGSSGQWWRTLNAFVRLISGQLAGNWRIVCLGVIVLEPSHISSLVRLLSRSLISAVCLCDKWYPVSITIDCLCRPDEKKAL